MRTAEQWMKDKLDGTFTSIDSNSHVVTEIVPKDFLPRICSEGLYVAPKAPKDVPTWYWTAEDDAKLIDLRDRKFSWIDIGARMGRSHKTCGQRYMKLRKEVIDILAG